MGFDLVRLRCIRSWREIRSSICSSSGSTGRYREADIAGQISRGRYHGTTGSMHRPRPVRPMSKPRRGQLRRQARVRAMGQHSPRRALRPRFSSRPAAWATLAAVLCARLGLMVTWCIWGHRGCECRPRLDMNAVHSGPIPRNPCSAVTPPERVSAQPNSLLHFISAALPWIFGRVKRS